MICCWTAIEKDRWRPVREEAARALTYTHLCFCALLLGQTWVGFHPSPPPGWQSWALGQGWGARHDAHSPASSLPSGIAPSCRHTVLPHYPHVWGVTWRGEAPGSGEVLVATLTGPDPTAGHTPSCTARRPARWAQLGPGGLRLCSADPPNSLPLLIWRFPTAVATRLQTPNATLSFHFHFLVCLFFKVIEKL